MNSGDPRNSDGYVSHLLHTYHIWGAVPSSSKHYVTEPVHLSTSGDCVHIACPVLFNIQPLHAVVTFFKGFTIELLIKISTHKKQYHHEHLSF